jgi:hypothetical protein
MPGKKEIYPMKKIIVLVLGLALGLAIAACQAAPAANNATPTPDRGPLSAVDSPLEGALLPQDTVMIQAHADDAQGVARGEISVGGQVIGVVESPNPGQPAAVFTLPWRPDVPGEYKIEVRAQNMTGTWGAKAARRIIISEPADTPTPKTLPTETATKVVATQAPTETPTIVIPTATSTQAAGVTPEPALPVLDNSIFNFSFSALHFYPANSKCLPNDSGLTVVITNMTNVANVFTFFAMTDSGVYHFPAHHWTSGLLMWQSTPGGNVFWHKIDSKSIISYVDYYPNYVLYQFVATDRNGTIVARSQIYRDMSIVKCKN